MSTIPTGRFRRLFRLASLGPRLGGAMVGGEGMRRAVAERMLHTLGELKGGSMKVGQILAQIADALPEEVRRQLEGLFHDAPSLPWEEMRAVVEAELGSLDGFAWFDTEPFAGASLGQVHGAVLPDGRVVAVKVQYPHVEEALTQDITNLRQFAQLSTAGGWVFDISAQLEAMQDALKGELDYRRELAALQCMRAVMARWPDLEVPEPIEPLCTGRVLTTILFEGPTLHEVDGHLPEPERVRLAGQLTRAVFGPVLAGAVINADAHPGNFVVMEGGKLGLLDFGAVREVPLSAAEGLRGLLAAMLDDPKADPVPHLQRMGFDFDPDNRRVRRSAEAMRAAIAPCFTGVHDFADDHTMEALMDIKRRHPLDSVHWVPPPATLHLMRAAMGWLHGQRLLGVRCDLSEVMADLVVSTRLKEGKLAV
jgi:predicted unusual protein kinase regulating ubiquinone biosynthesis (AarF/ABC1/UbiB family)